MMESPEAVILMSFVTRWFVWNLNLIICDLQIQHFTHGLCWALIVRGTCFIEFYDEINLLITRFIHVKTIAFQSSQKST